MASVTLPRLARSSSVRSAQARILMPSVERLKQRLTRSLKAKRIEAALETLSALEAKEPKEPVWPRRAARLLRVSEGPVAELAALRRALEIQVDRGRVLDAIATCKSILDIDPDHRPTLECLDLLYTSGAPTEGDEASEPECDAPLESLQLTDIVPGARSVQLADAGPGSVNEIPVDDPRPLSSSSSATDDVVDLRLEQFASAAGGDLKDLAAAQAMSLPTARESNRGRGSRESGRRGTLREELADIPLFGDLDPTSLHTLIRKVRVVPLEAGQELFRQGDPANSLYVVVDGAVIPIAEGERRRKLAVLERGEFFGEIGLLTKQPRNATIEALVDSKLLAIDRKLLWELIQRQPSVAKGLLRFLRSRLIDRQIRTNLFFAAFAHAERDTVARQFRILEVSEGTRIVEQGEPPDGLFVVLSGSLELMDRKKGKAIGGLELGDVFGGLSLIEGQAASADVVARSKCWLVVLGEGRFRRILDANPRLARVVRRLARDGRPDRPLPPVAAL